MPSPRFKDSFDCELHRAEKTARRDLDSAGRRKNEGVFYVYIDHEVSMRVGVVFFRVYIMEA